MQKTGSELARYKLGDDIDRNYLRLRIFPERPKHTKWMFFGWRVHYRETFWQKWRQVWALCKNICTGEVKEVYAIFERWRPPPAINTPTLTLGGDPSGRGSFGDVLDSTIELGKAIQEAGERGSNPISSIIMRQSGQKYCDQL